MQTTTTDHHYMTMALALAKQGQFSVSPNPMVGCVLVKEDKVIGQGFHLRAGCAHAEVAALENLTTDSIGATAYVTLEPCCHFGRTPPCTDALIKAGIKKVFVACLDPNPLVAGKGVEKLRAAGIEVVVGLSEAEAKALNVIFFHYITHKKPYVIAKWAMSLDGKTITHPNDSKKISCDASQQHTHELRHQVDAILIGANTARCDDPLLTARAFKNAAKQPLRIVLTSEQTLPKELKLFDNKTPGKTLIATTNPNYAPVPEQIEVLVLPKNKNNQVCLHSLLTELGKREITSLLVEGGMTVHSNFFEEKLVNKTLVYLAPVFIGSLAQKQKLSYLNCESLGGDFCFYGDCDV